MDQKLKIAVVGAGPSGLVAAKYSLEYEYECDVFEQTESLGGNWVYKDCVGVDKNGIEVQSSIYKHMTTNIPKELMIYPHFPYSENIKKSYIPHYYVREYYERFAEHFNVTKRIQFYTRVKRITPIDEKWNVAVQNIKTNTTKSSEYDAVFICNGRFKHTFTPQIEGQSMFEGKQIHSRNFKVPDPYRAQTVLIIGGNFSGQEIAQQISTVAKHVFFNCRISTNMLYPPNMSEKPDVKKLTKHGAIFVDGTVEKLDTVIYCTGYVYHCDFLTEECDLKLENNGVSPLYKQIINIKHQTMYFIGLPFTGASSVTFDLQVRFALAALRKKFILPSKENMLEEWEEFLKMKEKENIPKKYVHRLKERKDTEGYSEDLGNTANIEKIPKVFFDLYDRVLSCNRAHYIYKIVDDKTFEEIQL